MGLVRRCLEGYLFLWRYRFGAEELTTVRGVFSLFPFCICF